MKKTTKLLNLTSISFIICLLAVTPSALALTASSTASSNSSGQALEIDPPIINLTVNPGQSIKVPISIRDISTVNLIVNLQVNDFVAAGQNGTPKILFNNNVNDPYSLKNWIVPQPSFLLVPQQIKTINVTINVPNNASPGGHFGVIRFTPTSPSLHSTGVALAASLGALVLVTVNGNIKDNLSTTSFTINSSGQTGTFFESAPLNFVEKIKNNGNVQEQPTGEVTITDMFGKTVATLAVNQPPHDVLPGSIRAFTEPLNSTVIGNETLFGHYKASLSLNYGVKQKKVLTDSISFWVIPYKLIALIIVLLVGAFFGLRYFIKWYNRRIINISRYGSNRRR